MLASTFPWNIYCLACSSLGHGAKRNMHSLSPQSPKIWLGITGHLSLWMLSNQPSQINKNNTRKEPLSIYLRMFENTFYSRCLAAWFAVPFDCSKDTFGDLKYPLDCGGSRNMSSSNADSTSCPPQATIQQRKVISCSKDENSRRDKLLKQLWVVLPHDFKTQFQMNECCVKYKVT